MPENDWLVEVGAEIEPFESAWRQLATPDNSTPFQNFDLMRLFYRQLAARALCVQVESQRRSSLLLSQDFLRKTGSYFFASGSNRLMQPVIALVRRADGTPVALFAMMRTRRAGLNWLIMDARPLDYCVPLLDMSLNVTEIRSIIDAVLNAVPDVDLLYCNRLPRYFNGRQNPLVTLKNAGRLRFSAWSLDLAGPSLSTQSKRFRSNLRSSINRLAKAHRREFAIALAGEIDPAELAEFKALRAGSFRQKRRLDILGDPDWSVFYDNMTTDGGSCAAFLATLRADGRMIAGLWGFVDRDRVQAVLPASLTGKWKTYSPGIQLFHESFMYFHERGYKLYDLSIGDMEYKRRFGAMDMEIYDAMFPLTRNGTAYYFLWRIKVRIRDKLRPISS